MYVIKNTVKLKLFARSIGKPFNGAYENLLKKSLVSYFGIYALRAVKVWLEYAIWGGTQHI